VRNAGIGSAPQDRPNSAGAFPAAVDKQMFGFVVSGLLDGTPGECER